MSEPTDARRHLPQVERLVGEVSEEASDLPRPVVVDAVRTVVDALRERARRTETVPEADEIRGMVTGELERRRRRLLRPVINATGVIVHTNLGRAPLGPRAIEAVTRVAGGYSNLEYDLEAGRRGDRFVHAEPWLALATGAEAALVVNNNAAAVLLVCAALGRGREVVISRGELIEIGGSFRIPEVLAQSGAVLREVGTTNRTHLRDYASAISDETAFVLAVHPSNYRVVGFTAAPGTRELAELAHERGVPFVYDAGSGLVADPIADEPVVRRILSDGADLVSFSGDKLLGGPQAGVVVGRADLIARLRTHPLLRALRPGKLTLAALEATVASYLEGTEDEDVPVWRMLNAPAEELEARTSDLAEHLSGHGIAVEVSPGESVVGGGSLPGHGIGGPVLRIGARDPSAVAARLRRDDPPVIARVDADALVVDLRTVPPADDHVLAAALSAALG